MMNTPITVGDKSSRNDQSTRSILKNYLTIKNKEVKHNL